MKRRSVLAGVGALGSLGLAPGIAGAQTRRARRGGRARIVVVGAGALGGWTALHLAEAGAEVTLVDAYGPANSRSASGDETRLTRADYENPFYARLALEAYELWRARQNAWRAELLISSGQILLARAEGTEEITRLHRVLSDAEVADVSELEAREIASRWPQIDCAGIAAGLYTPGGRGASVIRARLATQCVARAFTDAGGRAVIARVTAFEPAPVGVRVIIENGEALEADIAVFACGAWMSGLFPQHIAPRVRIERRDVLYFGSPAGDTRFQHPALPAWAFINENYYGFADIDGRGVKIAPYPDRNAIDPDTDDRRVNAYVVERAEAFLRRRFPDLAGQPLLETRVCQVAYAPGENFIVDRHPDHENIWLVAGDSGHAFKHAPLLGANLARRALGRASDAEQARMFALAPAP